MISDAVKSMLAQKVTLGLHFQFFHRDPRIKFSGDLDTVCELIKRAGLDVGATWASPDFQISEMPVMASTMTASGQRSPEKFKTLILGLKNDLSPGDAQSEDNLTEIIAKRSAEERCVIARMAACRGGIRSFLSAIGSDLSLSAVRDEFGMTPVAWACAFGQAALFRAARDAGYETQCVNKFYWNTVDLALANKHLELAAEINAATQAQPSVSLIKRMREHGIPLKGSPP